MEHNAERYVVHAAAEAVHEFEKTGNHVTELRMNRATLELVARQHGIEDDEEITDEGNLLLGRLIRLDETLATGIVTAEGDK